MSTRTTGTKRVMLCSNCGEQFHSGAKSVRNARHNCADGSRGTGRPLGTDGQPEPSKAQIREKESQIEHIPADVEFTVPEDTTEPGIGLPDEPEPMDETPIDPTYLPPEVEPQSETQPEEVEVPHLIDPESQQKLAALVGLLNTIQTGKSLTPEQEAFCMQEALGGLVGISIEDSQPFVIPAWIYSATIGAAFVAYKAGLFKPADVPSKTRQTTMPVEAGRKDTASERGGWAADWEED